MDVVPQRELKKFYSIPDGDLFQMRVGSHLVFAINCTETGAGGSTKKLTIWLQDPHSEDCPPAINYLALQIADQWVVSFGKQYFFSTEHKSGVIDIAGFRGIHPLGGMILRDAGPALRVPPTRHTERYHAIEYDIRTASVTKLTDILDCAVLRPFSLYLPGAPGKPDNEILRFV